MSKEKTVDEVRNEFLLHIKTLINYWEKEPTQNTVKDRLSGLAFSILVAIDGCAMGLPSFILAPLPHEDDKQFNIDEENNFYPENHNSNVNCDISGCLHELFYKA